MAELKLTVGNFEATATATDENAIRVLQGALLHGGYDIENMSGDAQAAAVITMLVEYIQSVSAHGEVTQVIEAAKDDIAAKRKAVADAEALLPTIGASVASDPPTWNS